MSRIRSILARATGAFRAHRHDDDLAEELQSHIDMATADYVRRGMDPDAAERRARLEAGGVTAAAEAVRDQRGLPWIESIAADVKYAVRALRHTPAFSTVVIVTLALGIGANTAIFSVVRAVLLKPLPNRDGARLMYLRQSADGPGQDNLTFSVPEVRDLREGVSSLSGIAQYSSWSVIHQSGDEVARINVGLVTGNFFDVMGLSPVLGRLTQPGDDGKAAHPVAVLSYEYWMKRFAGDTGIVGKPISLDRKPVTVIGVLEPAPFFPARVDAFLNLVNSEHHLGASMLNDRSHRMTEVLARLKPDASIDRARAEVDAVTTRAHKEFRQNYDPAAHYRVSVIPFKEVLGERARLTLWLLMASAAFVLIISAANVANLTLMRGVRREPELTVRAALGAGVARLRRLLLAENLVLAIAGGALGVVIAIGGVRLLASLAERYSPRANEVRLDGVVLAFALGLSVTVAIVLSSLASLPREGTFAAAIIGGAQRMSAGLKRNRLQRGLVVLQVAVSVVLLAGAGLLTRTMAHLAEVDTGLTTQEVLTMQVSLLTSAEQRSREARTQASANYRRMRDEIRALPGVTDVGIGPAPLRNTGYVVDVGAAGHTLAPGEATPRGELRTATPTYFQAAGIPLLEGRAFSTSDSDAVIINETMARRLFRNESPLGKRIAWNNGITPELGAWSTVVGVIGNVRDNGVDENPRGEIFIPSENGGTFVIRAKHDAGSYSAAATRIVRRIAPNALIENVQTVAQIKAEGVAPRRLNAVLISMFGILAVVIAAVGIAGVLAFSVSARTNEIGIRMSLGANRSRVQRMILGEGGVLLLAGLTLGMIGSFFAVGVIRGLLVGVSAHDPATLLGVSGCMAAIGLVACWIPALRASRIDPAITMRG
jgi:predicted permease